MRALLAVALLAQACAGSYAYRSTLERPDNVGLPSDCYIEVLEGPPRFVARFDDEHPRELFFANPDGLTFSYWELGVIEFRGRRGSDLPTRDINRCELADRRAQ